MTGDPGPAIRLAGVSHLYGATCALDSITLDLPRGEAVALVGPDGVGKSTLLGLIAGVRRPQTGYLSVLGHDLVATSAGSEARAAFLSRIAYMPQGLGKNLYPTLSVAENIDFFGRLFGLDAKARAAHTRRLLDATGLAPFPDRPAGKLSGGMKQKLGLCCALVHDPDLLILDEPTTGVDPLSRRQFWDLVDAIRAERPGLTVLVATAYMDEAERFAHLVAMDDGRIIATGPTADVIAGTGAKTLEAAYIRLLPPERRPEGDMLVVPAYVARDEPPAIEAHDLVRRFGDFVAVDHVNFSIARGEIFGFLGSNGCGKTTTMKMLTGLIDATEGSATLFGKTIEPGDMATRMRVGYMSQAFSLYEELTVRQNLALHARLYRIPAPTVAAVIARSLEEFALDDVADALPGALPLGIRQRLQLAAACLHRPEVLILDEPTSGVDPAARDMFWRHLVRLSREDQVTIFVSTHFMNEAERCDRISLMHRGRVLAMGRPADLVREQHAANLEDAFIAVLEVAEGPGRAAPTAPSPTALSADRPARGALFGWLGFVWAFALREALELWRDPVRLGFALIGPLVLAATASFAISFDVSDIRLMVIDHDRSASSRDLVRHFQGSRSFRVIEPAGAADPDSAMISGKAQATLDIPPGFGRDLAAGRHPEVGMAFDGSSPFVGSNAQAFAQMILLGYEFEALSAHPEAVAADPHLAPLAGMLAGSGGGLPLGIAPRFVYNQEFRSIYAMAPGVLMLAMILFPAMLTALGVVREKEIGSIINLYASPAGSGAFLLGKQAPYVVVGMASFASLVVLSVVVLGVPLKGSLLALAAGGMLFTLASTGLGLMISAFVRSQISAMFATALLCLIPSVNFSGLLYPVSTLDGASYWVGLCFPSGWFQIISLGTFTKGLGLLSFARPYAVLSAFALGFLVAAQVSLRKQAA
ncbi:ribosome-associated ATPase/putative transporter RbbA [Novosphingobium sp. Fuku2-ISO-50]|uniref:ribosome-associated ATPase/putative transporter RbbA n=1 Tax=Novosphingobium sp. Fuku2-ISO-50 TaxID=1739114 RepID=UPI00076BEB64|nr:ribosome-associated ATPase/putative transporter RbbA [Novosphingobium sp. Fuku2-ISO-50]KUR78761.1 multidrug ABC transporter ATP-binding protein [Novosphingobium sp. Fuku2-ISO-50]